MPTSHFFWRKLHSLMGIIPLGVFLLVHLFINSFALKGENAFNHAAGFMKELPYLIIIELEVILIPLLFHIIYGILVLWRADSDLRRYPRLSLWMYFLQRATGIAAIIFIAAHLYHTTISMRFINHQEITFQYMSFLFNNPLTLVFYLVGLAAVVFHFANGIWNFLITWGITAGRNSQRTMGWVCAVVGFAIFLSGANIIAAFLGAGITIFNG
ncbi:MAG: succinate dehydrogenase [bacterium]